MARQPLRVAAPKLSPTLVRQGLARARAITRRRASPLVQAARSLRSPTKRASFECTYAAKQIIGDAVDEHGSGRGGSAPINRRLAQAEAAMRGEFTPSADTIKPALFAALTAFGGASGIGVEAWRRLARARQSDVRGRRLGRWGDFLVCSEGASVAPVEIFIYILTTDVGPRRVTRCGLPRDSTHYAGDLALYCYLVHIIRGLALDVRTSVETLQGTLLRRCDLDKGCWLEPSRGATLERSCRW